MNKTAVGAVTEALDALDIAEKALAEMRQVYEASPGDWELSRRFGVLQQKVISLKKARRPKPVYVKPTRPRQVDGQEWKEAVRAIGSCPHCGGWVANSGLETQEKPLPAAGYCVPYGHAGAQCLLCKKTFELEI